MGQQVGSRFSGFVAAVVVSMGCLLASSSAATAAAAPDLLWQQPPDLLSGSTAGRMKFMSGMDVAPSNGHLLVADWGNARMVEFDAWGQFVKAWGWGVRDGSAELQTCGPDAQPPSSECQPGIVGTGPGQMSSPRGVAVGSDDSIYVYEDEGCVEGDCKPQNFRVQKFSLDGEFVLMFGGEVNKTKSAEVGSTSADRNLCTAVSGDTCGIGVFDAGPPDPGAFSNRTNLDAIDIGSDGTIFVGDVGRIQAFEPSGAFKDEVVGALAGETVRSLALDGADNFFVTLVETFSSSKPNVRKLTPAGVAVSSFPIQNPGAIAIDDEENLWAVETIGAVPGSRPRVVKYSSSGQLLIPDQEETERVEEAINNGEDVVPAFAEAGGNFAQIPSLATSSACGIPGVDVFVGNYNQEKNETFVSAYGPSPDPELCPPPVVPPTIQDQYATTVDSDEATLKAKINPHFWGDTTFYVEYGTGLCSEGGCAAKTQVEDLGPQVVDALVITKGTVIGGLAAETTYHYRFVAESGGGGPVYGSDPDGDGPKEPDAGNGTEGAFTTPPAPQDAVTNCPNAAFRVGPSALLEDCRAYEMVSPVDKNNGDILTLPDSNSNPAAFNQASLEGSRFGYSAYRAFGNAESSPYTSQYMARRTESGWVSDGISPKRGISLVSGEGLQAEYRLFSPDLCAGWLFHDSEPILAPDAVAGFSNLYRRDTCGAGGYEAITTTQPACSPVRNFIPEVQGVSADGAHAAFRVRDKLTSNAANCVVGGTENKAQCYESSSGGVLRVISVLPNGSANTGDCSLGAGNVVPLRYSTVETAISGDGSRVYWTDKFAGPGTLYLRINADKAQSPLSGGTCTNPDRACTIEVGKGRFWRASSDGTRALFTNSSSAGGADSIGGTLLEFDLETKSASPIAGEVIGLMGASKDISKVYLASREDLDAGAVAGEPNVYLYDAGAAAGSEFTYIATLASSDLPPPAINSTPSPLNPVPFTHTARVTEDGAHVAFTSTSPLTGEENTDAGSGEPDAEVFIYDAAADELSCASCLSSGVRPDGRELQIQSTLSGSAFSSGIWAASFIPGYETQLYPPRVLSSDGSRLFFQSFQALVRRDDNRKQDVYEWEAVSDGSDPTNTCTEASPAYRPGNDGCVSLVSSGDSAQDSVFLDASANGSDVFFTTSASLVSSDPGLIDIYDARVRGGFAPPAPPIPPCQGEACQSPAPAPSDPAPASATFHGSGNVDAKGPRKKCRKGKVRRHGKCVKKHRKKAGQHRKGARR